MASYEVGYGKPPVSGRFRAGVSGNPKGRPEAQADSRSPSASRPCSTRRSNIESGEEPRSRPIAN